MSLGRGLHFHFTKSHPTDNSQGEILKAIRAANGEGGNQEDDSELSFAEFDRFLCSPFNTKGKSIHLQCV